MKKIIVVGGTHGNEWTGIYLIKHFSSTLQKKFNSLKIQFLQGNPKAFEATRRFTETDLNRVFEAINNNKPQETYEYTRGLEIKKTIDDSSDGWLFDIHTTTSNLGSTLIITRDEIQNFKLAAYAQKKIPHLKIIYSPDPAKKYLVSQSEKGLMLEIGPIANNLVDTRILNETCFILETLLQGLTNDEENNSQGEIEVFEEVGDIFYPQVNGEIVATVHPDLQSKDFFPLKKGDFNFLGFDGKEYKYEGEDELFPIFINEAAYYPSKIAFGLCRRISKNT